MAHVPAEKLVSLERVQQRTAEQVMDKRISWSIREHVEDVSVPQVVGQLFVVPKISSPRPSPAACRGTGFSLFR